MPLFPGKRWPAGLLAPGSSHSLSQSRQTPSPWGHRVLPPRCYLLGTAGRRQSPPAGTVSLLLRLSWRDSVSVDISSPPFSGGFCLLLAAGDALSSGLASRRRFGEGGGGGGGRGGGRSRRQVAERGGLRPPGGTGEGGPEGVFSPHGRMEVRFGRGPQV